MFEYSHLFFYATFDILAKFLSAVCVYFFCYKLKLFFWHFILNICFFVLPLFGYLSHVAADKFLRSQRFFFQEKPATMTCVPGSFFSPTSFILVKLSMEKFFFNHGLNNEGRRMYRTIISVWRTIPNPQITFRCLLNITSL